MPQWKTDALGSVSITHKLICWYSFLFLCLWDNHEIKKITIWLTKAHFSGIKIYICLQRLSHGVRDLCYFHHCSHSPLKWLKLSVSPVMGRAESSGFIAWGILSSTASLLQGEENNDLYGAKDNITVIQKNLTPTSAKHSWVDSLETQAWQPEFNFWNPWWKEKLSPVICPMISTHV